MRTLNTALAAVTALAAAGAACTPTLPVEQWRLPEIDVGAARALVVVAGDGRPAAVDEATAAVVRAARADGYFDVDGRLAGRALTLLVDVPERSVSDSVDTTTVIDPQGAESTSTVVTTTAAVVLLATVLDDAGDAVIDGYEIEGVAELQTEGGAYVDADALLAEAAQAAARGLLDRLTPRRDVVTVRLDDEDEGQRPILQAAQHGALEPALARMVAYVAAHPESASARYNEGAINDALGRYDAALAAYDAALATSTKAWYASSRAACAERASAARALGL